MEFFTEEINKRLQKENKKTMDFEEKELYLRTVSTADTSTNGEDLLKIKQLFQKMLPKMPREYILKQVFDIKHCTLTINHNSSLIGAVCYRPAFHRHLVEIVFFAIDSSHHINGYGTFLFNCLKEVCKAQYCQFIKVGEKYKSTNVVYRDLQVFDATLEEKEEIYARGASLYMLTYADNSAIGFFKKQGFSLRPRSTEWVGFIKDYDGGTLMECKIHKGIQYLKTGVLIKKVVDFIFDKMQNVNNYHIVQGDANREELRKLLGEYGENSVSEKRSSSEFLRDFLRFLLYKIQSNPSAWPFLEPVNTKDVPDYLNVITTPMDLSLIHKKYLEGCYLSLDSFESDVHLMVNNCFTYNGKDTQYYKCAEIIKNYYESIKLQYFKVLNKWGISQGTNEGGIGTVVPVSNDGCESRSTAEVAENSERPSESKFVISSEEHPSNPAIDTESDRTATDEETTLDKSKTDRDTTNEKSSEIESLMGSSTE